MSTDATDSTTEDIEARFARLRAGGIEAVRIAVPWSAVESAGPGRYDEAFVARLRKIVNAAERQGIAVTLAARAAPPAWAAADPQAPERLLDAFRHCYRRLKNCRALAGWEAPEGDEAFLIRFVERMKEAGRPAVFSVDL